MGFCGSGRRAVVSAGASEVGLDLEAQYVPTARRPDPQKPTSYTARFPFRTYRTDRFWAHSEADPHTGHLRRSGELQELLDSALTRGAT